MRGFAILMLGAATIATGGCRGGETANNSVNAQAPAATANSATPVANETSVQTMERTTSNGQQIQTKELVGPDVQPAGTRPIRQDEIDEIEKATGRPYQEGDSIYGRAEPVRNGQ